MKVFWSHLELDLRLLELPVGLEIIMYRYKHMCIYCIIQLYTSVSTCFRICRFIHDPTAYFPNLLKRPTMLDVSATAPIKPVGWFQVVSLLSWDHYSALG